MRSNKLEQYEVLETIGSGSYGTCKKVRRKSDSKVCLRFKVAFIHAVSTKT